MIVQLKRRHPKYPDLSPGQQYVVIGIEADDLRVLNDQGRPYLYPVELFKVVDKTEDEEWITMAGDDGERYAYPRTLNRVGFFEDFFDGDSKTVATFWRVVNRHLAAAS